MITAANLKTQTVKDLSQMAKQLGVAGWHTMRKDQLVRALVRAAKSKSGKASRTSGGGKTKKASRPARRAVSQTKSKSSNRRLTSHGRSKTAIKAKKAKPKNPRVTRRIQKAQAARERERDLSTNRNGSNGHTKDRVVLLVRDPFWLQACWEISRQSVERARAAMAEHWHTARPTLRILEVEVGATTSTTERVLRDIEVHGGVKNWYIDVKDGPKSYRADLGYLADNGKFHTLARSNSVTTPSPGSSDAIDENWNDVAENYERIYALSGGYSEDNVDGQLQELFEERLRRPMGSPVVTRYGDGAEKVLNRKRDFSFEVDAEMIIYGSTKPDAHVTLANEPVKLRPDGTFTVRLSMPDRRQVLPVVASSSDGVEQRTIVLAVERNTKVMEPMIRDGNE